MVLRGPRPRSSWCNRLPPPSGTLPVLLPPFRVAGGAIEVKWHVEELRSPHATRFYWFEARGLFFFLNVLIGDVMDEEATRRLIEGIARR